MEDFLRRNLLAIGGIGLAIGIFEVMSKPPLAVQSVLWTGGLENYVPYLLSYNCITQAITYVQALCLDGYCYGSEFSEWLNYICCKIFMVFTDLSLTAKLYSFTHKKFAHTILSHMWRHQMSQWLAGRPAVSLAVYKPYLSVSPLHGSIIVLHCKQHFS